MWSSLSIQRTYIGDMGVSVSMYPRKHSVPDVCANVRVIYIYTTGKKYGIILYLNDFLHFCGVCMVFLYLKYIPTSQYYFWGSQFALNRKMKRKGSKTIMSLFFSIRLWLEFLLSLGPITAISIRLLYRDIVHNTIVHLTPIWCGQQGISVVGGLHRRTWGVILVYHKVMYTKY